MFKKVRSHDTANMHFDVYCAQFKMEDVEYDVELRVVDDGVYDEVEIFTSNPFDLSDNIFFARYSNIATYFGLGEEYNVKRSSYQINLAQKIRRAARRIGVNIPIDFIM